MLKRERRELAGEIRRLVQEIYAMGTEGLSETFVEHRVDKLLKELLFEGQPIVETQTTVLFADIRGFTALTRTLPPPTMIRILNRYFEAMTLVIHRHEGMVDKFMGDSVMALFGAPTPRPGDLQRALSCAVEMQQAMAVLNREFATLGWPKIYAGIALNTGPVMAGSFGSDLHREYTVIGDTVNLAARMEPFSLRGQVLLSHSVHQAAGDGINVGRINEVKVKGMSTPLRLYELRSVKGPADLVVPETDGRRSPRITVDLDAIFHRVMEKRVGDDALFGRVTDLGYFGLSADLPEGLPDCSEVVIELGASPFISFEPVLGHGIEDPGREVYARVLRSRPVRGMYRTSMEFTTVGTGGHSRVKSMVDHALWHR